MWEISYSAQSFYTWCLMRADAAHTRGCRARCCLWNERFFSKIPYCNDAYRGSSVSLCEKLFCTKLLYFMPDALLFHRALLSVEQAFLLQLQSWRITLIEVQVFLDARKLFCKWIKEKGWRRQRHSQRQGKKGTRWKKVKRENRQIHGSQILNHFLGPMNNKTCDKERKPRVCPAGALPQDCLRWQHSPSSKMPASSVSNFSYVRMVARACWWCSSPSF